MLCEHCNQKEATTTIKINHNGQLTERHLCHDCAKELGYGSAFANPFLNFNSLLGTLFGTEQTLPSRQSCAVCGATYEDFARTGKVGCASCYQAFARQLLPTIQKIHGNAHHTGKSPKKQELKLPEEQHLTVTDQPEQTAEEELEKLQQQLQEAIAAQEFEQAAALRDAIHALKGGEAQ